MIKVYKKITPFLAALIIVYLIANIVWSQNISSIYFKLSNIKSSKIEMKKSAYNLLISIRKLPFYKDYLTRYKNVFGNSIEEDIRIENKKRFDYLENLNALLEKNPKSRDVLFRLYIYYKEEGNIQKALQYLNTLKQIDPDFIP